MKIQQVQIGQRYGRNFKSNFLREISIVKKQSVPLGSKMFFFSNLKETSNKDLRDVLAYKISLSFNNFQPVKMMRKISILFSYVKLAWIKNKVVSPVQK